MPASRGSPATMWSKTRNAVREAISLTAQEAAVDGVLTGAENLRMMARLRRVKDGRARTRELLERFDLTDAADRRVATYSGGMRRRLDLAMSLVSRPEVIFLDEPSTGLDPRSRLAVWEAVQALASDGATILLTTQYLEEADRLADRIAVVDGGRIAALGTAQELKARVGEETLELFFADAETLAAAQRRARRPRDRRRPEPAGRRGRRRGRPRGAGRAQSSRRERRPPRGPSPDARRSLPRPHRPDRSTRMTDSLTFVGRSLRHSVRSIDALITAIMLPVAIMLMFVYVFGGAIDVGGHYVDYVVPGIIVLCAGFGSAGTAVAVALDMTTGVVDRFRTLPISAAAVLTGHVTASVVRNVASTLLVLGVALIAGFRPVADPLNWLAAAGLLLALMIAISWLAACFGLVARSVEAANAITFVAAFAPYLSSAFVPASTMPAGLRWVAEHQPVTPIADTLRELMFDLPVGNEAIWAIGWCVAGIVIGRLGAAYLFGRR